MRAWIFPLASGVTAFVVSWRYFEQMESRFGRLLTILIIGFTVGLTYGILSAVFNT